MGSHADLVRYRRARESDASAIAHVHVTTWRDAYRDHLPGPYLDAMSVERRTEWWARELPVMAAHNRPWLAETRDGVVGFAIGGRARDDDARAGTGEVYAIYVLPECWMLGVGRALLGLVERDLLAQGFDEATLWVLASNDRARRFYESRGWHADGTSKQGSYGGRVVKEVRYRVALDPSRVSELVQRMPAPPERPSARAPRCGPAREPASADPAQRRESPPRPR